MGEDAMLAIALASATALTHVFKPSSDTTTSDSCPACA